MKFCVVFLALIATACRPRCLQGHYETRRVEAECHFEFRTIGEAQYPIYVCMPAFDERVFICDRYEVEKEL